MAAFRVIWLVIFFNFFNLSAFPTIDPKTFAETTFEWLQEKGLAKPHTLTVAFEEAITLKLPLDAITKEEKLVVHALFEGLVSWHERQSIRPCVATAWKASSNSKNWTFFLNPAASWSNGTPVTSYDFLYSWKKNLLARGSLASLPELCGKLQGVEPFLISNGKSGGLGILAPNAHTLVIKLNQPVSARDLLSALTSEFFFPLPAGEVNDFKGIPPHLWVVNGPFQIETFEETPSKQLLLKPNPHYRIKPRKEAFKLRFLPKAVTPDYDLCLAKRVEPKLFSGGETEAPRPYFAPGESALFLRFSRVNAFGGTVYPEVLSLAVNREVPFLFAEAIWGTASAGFVHPAYYYHSLQYRAALSEKAIRLKRANALLQNQLFLDGKQSLCLYLLYRNASEYQLLTRLFAPLVGLSKLTLIFHPFGAPIEAVPSSVEGATVSLERIQPIGGTPKAYLEAFIDQGLPRPHPRIVAEIKARLRSVFVHEEDFFNAYRELEFLLLRAGDLIPIAYENSTYLLSPNIAAIQVYHPNGILHWPSVRLSYRLPFQLTFLEGHTHE